MKRCPKCHYVILQRSLKANAFYWAVILKTIAEHTGNDIDDLHSFFKSKFLKKIIQIQGETVVIAQSTTQLNAHEFTRYADQVMLWAGQEFGLSFPDPEDQKSP